MLKKLQAIPMIWTKLLIIPVMLIAPVMHDVSASSATLDNDLVKTHDWVYDWKMSFEPDKNKQAQEGIFWRKTGKYCHTDLYFKNQ